MGCSSARTCGSIAMGLAAMSSGSNGYDDPLEGTVAGIGQETISFQAVQEPEGPAIELELTDLAYGGDAVGRYQGRAVFVTGGLPGEYVRARITRERSNYARAALVEVLRASPDRIEPPYPDLGPLHPLGCRACSAQCS